MNTSYFLTQKSKTFLPLSTMSCHLVPAVPYPNGIQNSGGQCVCPSYPQGTQKQQSFINRINIFALIVLHITFSISILKIKFFMNSGMWSYTWTKPLWLSKEGTKQYMKPGRYSNQWVPPVALAGTQLFFSTKYFASS